MNSTDINREVLVLAMDAAEHNYRDEAGKAKEYIVQVFRDWTANRIIPLPLEIDCSGELNYSHIRVCFSHKDEADDGYEYEFHVSIRPEYDPECVSGDIRMVVEPNIPSYCRTYNDHPGHRTVFRCFGQMMEDYDKLVESVNSYKWSAFRDAARMMEHAEMMLRVHDETREGEESERKREEIIRSLVPGVRIIVNCKETEFARDENGNILKDSEGLSLRCPAKPRYDSVAKITKERVYFTGYAANWRRYVTKDEFVGHCTGGTWSIVREEVADD